MVHATQIVNLQAWAFEIFMYLLYVRLQSSQLKCKIIGSTPVPHFLSLIIHTRIQRRRFREAGGALNSR